MKWYKIILTNDQLIAGENERLQHILVDLAKKGLHQKGMALFSKSIIEKHSSNHYEYKNMEEIDILYVSPVAYAVLQNEMRHYKVVPIEKPDQKNLVALYWNQDEAFESL
ncbi:MAG: hypothetical protein ACE5H1_06800 [Thermodesulfobacteriota bacterium]